MSEEREIKFVDLCCGIGGTRIGFEQACKAMGIKSRCVFSADKKKAAITAYRHNFGDDCDGDITKLDEKELPDFDVILAGIPCQAFSYAGMRRGFADTRGTLFFDIERIAQEKDPSLIVIENVEGLVSHDKGRTMQVMVKRLERLGYKVSHRVLSGLEFGLAQDRRRIYIVASKDKALNFDGLKKIRQKTIGDIRERGIPPVDTAYTKALLSHYKPEKLAGAIITDKRGGERTIHSWDFEMKGSVSPVQKEIMEFMLKNSRRRKYAEELGVAWRDGMPLMAYQIEREMGKDNLTKDLDDLAEKGYLIRQRPYKDGSLEFREDLPEGYKLITSRISFEFHRILDDKGTCITLTATDCSKIALVEEKGIRGLTVRECLRLFGFPEDYDLNCVDKSRAYDLVGNSICVPVVKAIAMGAIEQKLL